MSSAITNIYNKKTKRPALRNCSQPQENWFFFYNWRCSMCARRVTRHTSIRYSSSPAGNGRPFDSCLHRHPVSANCLYHARMVSSVGGSFAYFARNAGCTVTTDLLCDIPTHKTTSTRERPFSHYIHSHRLAAEMWTTMKNNLLWKHFWVVSSIFASFVNTCPTVFL